MFMDHDAEEHYAARVAEVYRGNPNLGGVFLEPKNVPYLLPPLGEIITAWTGKIFFLDVDGALLLGKFLFPFLLSLFVYAFAFSVSRARLTALIAVVYVLLGGAYLSDFGLMRDLLFGHIHAGSFTFFSRPVNPQLSDLFLFAALYFLYQDFFVRERPRVWVVGIVGVLTGASLYMSPYTFSFMGGVLGGIFLWFAFARAWPKVVGAALAVAATVVALIPFIYNYALLHQAPQYPLLAQRLGFVSNHTPVLGIWLTVLLVAVVLWPHMYQKARVFFFGMVVVLWLVINQHVLTGIYMQPGHFHWYITKPLVGLVAALYVGWLLSRIQNVRLKTGVALLAVFSLLYTSPLFHVPFYAAGASAKTITTETYAPVVKTLQQLPVGGVWADSDMSLYIPIYTADTVPNNLYAIYYLNDEWKFEYVTFMRYRLMGTTPANVSEVFTKDRAAISDRLYSLYYPALVGSAAAIPDTILADLAKKYTMFYKKSYAEVFSELGVRYVVAPKEAKAQYDAISGLTLIQTPGGYLIYAVKNE
jgi:hypothetical protein